MISGHQTKQPLKFCCFQVLYNINFPITKAVRMLELPLIYSELLPNIRQLSIIAVLPTPSNASTKAKLSPIGDHFVLHHNGITTSFELPGRAALDAMLQKPAIGDKELSWRLHIGSMSVARPFELPSNEAPWSAASLSDDVKFSCRDCGNVVLERGSMKAWKDLPSENWAEMMDFWHCHKPDVPHAHGDEQTQPDKGYGPASRFAATPGVGFVDLTTLLLSEEDCIGIQVGYPLLRFPFLFHFWFVLIWRWRWFGNVLRRQDGYQEGGHARASSSVVWSPIQVPQSETSSSSHRSQLAYPAFPNYGLPV